MRTSAPSQAPFVRALVRAQPLAYATTALAWIVWNSWALVPGVLAQWFFDALGGKAPFGLGVAAILALFVASGAARAGVMGVAAKSGVRLRFRMRAQLQTRVIARILRLPGAQAIDVPVGEAISTLRDDAEAGALAADWPYDAVAGLVFAGGGLLILFQVNARLTLLVFLPISLLLALGNLARSRLVGVRAQSRQATADVTAAIGEVFHSVEAIQTAGAEQRVLQHLAGLGDARRRAMVRDKALGALFDAVFRYVMQLGAGLVLLFAASAMRSGSFTVGDFALFATYLMQVADFMGFVGYLISSYQQSAVSFARLLRLARGEPEVLMREPAVPLAAAGEALGPLQDLAVRDLNCLHPGGEGIRGASFTLRRGTITVVTGRLGAGKTTLLRALLGLLPQAGGEVLWNGRLLTEPSDAMTPPRVAYVPQVPSLLSGTIAENIALGEPASPADLRRAVQAAALLEDLDSLPEAFATEIGARGVRLSGGQAQRVAIARALLRQPDLLVLDDPTSALDPETERRLLTALSRSGQTCLIATSSTLLLQQADQLLWLVDGSIAAIGSFDELTARGLRVR